MLCCGGVSYIARITRQQKVKRGKWIVCNCVSQQSALIAISM